MMCCKGKVMKEMDGEKKINISGANFPKGGKLIECLCRGGKLSFSVTF